MTLAACDKDYDNVSQVQKTSYPTITINGGIYYSINIGGSLPTISATAYDSTLKESYPVVINGSDDVDNSTPGLYVITARATNKYGFYSDKVIYVAVTDVSPDVNLAGEYRRTANNELANVARLARGLYMTDDVGGAAALEVAALFVHINDTTIEVPPQPTDVGTLYCDNTTLHMAPGDTSYSYIVHGSGFGLAVRKFVKQ